MTFYAKITLLKADGDAKISLVLVRVSNIDTFTDEMAAELLNHLSRTEATRFNAVSVAAEWISPMEAEQIIKNLRNKQ